MKRVGGVTEAGRVIKVLCAPYHIYTHHDVLAGLFASMAANGWEVSMMLPFTAPVTLERMASEAAALPGVRSVLDFTSRRLTGSFQGGTLARVLRAAALALYFIRAACLLVFGKPDVLLLTSDLGGVSVRFVQIVCGRLNIPIVTLQSTLFLRVAEREDLKFEFKPRWLHRFLSRGVFKQLFLYFGEVPGTFLQHSYVGVQDEEIRRVCVEFGKNPAFIEVFGSLQAAKIRAARSVRSPAQARALPRVLFLSECIAERYGDELAQRNIDWMLRCARALGSQAHFSVRFHPRESAAYCERFLESLGTLCSIDAAENAVDAAANADIIVGAYSMLMFDAQSAGVATIFLDVGEDPLGFYSERRNPLAATGEELVQNASRLIASRVSPTASAAANPDAWVRNIVQWIHVLIVRHRG